LVDQLAQNSLCMSNFLNVPATPSKVAANQLIVLLLKMKFNSWQCRAKPWQEEEPNDNTMVSSSWKVMLSVNIFKLLESQRITGRSTNENDNVSLSTPAQISFSSNSLFCVIRDFLFASMGYCSGIGGEYECLAQSCPIIHLQFK